MSRSIVGLLALIASVASASEYHTSPYCWSEPRIHAEERPAAPSVEIQRVEASLPSMTSMSPNKAYAYHLSDADRTSEPPWETRLFIYTERPYLLQLVFSDCEAARPQWLNEKLLFVRVWWGRIAGTDYLVDVEKEAIVLAEHFRYGAIAFRQFQQCSTPQWQGSEHCKCYPGQPEGWWPPQLEVEAVDSSN